MDHNYDEFIDGFEARRESDAVELAELKAKHAKRLEELLLGHVKAALEDCLASDKVTDKSRVFLEDMMGLIKANNMPVTTAMEVAYVISMIHKGHGA